MKRSDLSLIGLEKAQIDQVMELYGGDVELLKEKHTESQKALQDKLSAAQEEAKTLKAELAEKPGENLQAKLDELQAELQAEKANAKAAQDEFESYKASEGEKAAAKELRDKQTKAVRSELIARGFMTEAVDDFMLEKLDYESLELDGEKLKDADACLAPMEERYAKYKVVDKHVGAGVATPPAGNGGGVITIEDVKKMSPAEINQNWDKVQKVMNKQ